MAGNPKATTETVACAAAAAVSTARGELLTERATCRRPSSRAGEEVIENGRIETLPLGERARFGERGHRRPGHEVVAEFRGLPRAGSTHVDDEASQCF